MLAAYCSNCGNLTLSDAILSQCLEEEVVHCSSCHSALEVTSGEDIFISYSTSQIEHARRLAEGLHQRGVRFWLAPDYIGVGENFTEKIPEALERARVVVLLLSKEAINSPWVKREASMAAELGLKLVGVLLGDVPLTRQWRFLLHVDQRLKSDADFKQDDLLRVLREISRTIAPTIAEDQSCLQLPVALVGPPKGVDQNARVYVGPCPFPDGNSASFFGRDVENTHISHSLMKHPAVLLYSPSGAGKSSLLAAGLLPIFRSAGHQVLSGSRFGRALPDKYKSRHGEINNIFSFSAMYSVRDQLTPTRPNLTLTQYLGALPEPESGKLRLLVLDQFEEIFTQHRDRFTDRGSFVDELVEAMEADVRLRVVLAMREEYLAEFLHLFDRVPYGYMPERIRLGRLSGDSLKEVITRPAEKYASFDPAVVEQIIRQLRMVRVVQPDGTQIDQLGEYVELCHLQIVCDRLWRSLDNGTKQIEMMHLDQAAQSFAGQNFSNFVKNALEVFYNECVVQVANSDITAKHGGYSPELIKLGCMKFVSRDGRRLSIQEGENRTGRLPNWIINQLADLYLLRIDTVGTDRWYELSHDLLAESISREIDHGVSELLFASELLEKQLAKLLNGEVRTLTGLFPEYRDLVIACRPFQLQPGLFPDEAELILRISLCTGQDLPAWSKRVKADYPELLHEVSLDALQSEEDQVRCHVSRMLLLEPDNSLAPRLGDLLTNDRSSMVRRAIASGMLALDDPSLYENVMTDRPEARNSETWAKRLWSMSLLRAMADVRHVKAFELSYNALPLGRRSRIRMGAWALRLRDGLAVFPAIFLPAAIFAALVAGPYKMLPAAFNFSMVQEAPSAGTGMVHGIYAGVIWGGLIPIGLMLHRVIFWNTRRPDTLLRPIGSLFAGLLAGIVTSAIVVGSILGVYGIDSLQIMGWVDGGLSNENRWSAEFMHDVFIKTRMGWVHMIMGTCLGLGMAFTLNGMRASKRWPELLDCGTQMVSIKSTWGVIRRIARHAAMHSWSMALMQLMGVALTCLVVRPGDMINDSNSHIFLSALGDASTQYVGAVASMTGAGIGILVMRHGINIPAQGEDQWSATPKKQPKISL
ncbi:MAG: toll/interleukin-1 receptor domain-containing protein [Phycisphaeraceae bacterium]